MIIYIQLQIVTNKSIIMLPTLHHTLKNFVNRGINFPNPIDVRKVIDITHRKRMFCIFDPDYLWIMNIEYDNPINTVSVLPVISANGSVGVALAREYEPSSIITLRYKSLLEIENEKSEIKRLQEIIKKYDEEQNINLQNYALKHNINLQNIKSTNN